ncbi:low molecular weight phosphotyrosine protein phosphatase [Lysobacter auxotrophicus]|uniref:protein-tyrosine-phosphatase n=1 Tax=Lysobacter auxotrophicus TaxID=2992573 RepID=A0ABN6UL23_9GAMM|nr:low molecular weight phosphotyrosine protein phosphatase [Lysobacter auxotrophicus]BDU17049.1 low molecular weight phosphotyrosine protein phosphatase [Lysobacter auxotrophicus]
MAEAIVRARLLRPGMQVASAGLAAMRGYPIDPKAQAVLAAHGYDGSEHVARQATKLLMQQSDLVLAMEQRQVAAVLALCPTLRGRVLMLSHWQDASDIDDPYGRDQRVFDAAFDRIESCIRDWKTKL